MIVLNSVPLHKQIGWTKKIILPIVNKCKLLPIRMSEHERGVEIVWTYPASYMSFANIYAYIDIISGDDGRTSTSFTLNHNGKGVMKTTNFQESEKWITETTEFFIKKLEKIAAEVGAI